MGLIHVIKSFALTIRESATDGSDFTNPDADYRVLFLGEDAALHVKDSAGVVTGILGAWTSYTPAWTSTGTPPAIGNGTLVGRYKELDQATVAIHIEFSAGSTTTFGTGDWSFSLPVNAVAGFGAQVLNGMITDSGTDSKVCTARLLASASTFNIIPEGGNLVGPTDPMTWAVNDSFRLNGIYESV